MNNILLLAFFVLITLSCANQTSPTGGPKDEKPPKLLSSTPKHKSLNFTENKIVLEFDEALKLNKPKNEIIITPRVKHGFEIKQRKNKVTLELKDTLSANTTYTINFRESIQDLNEGNTPKNLKLAFSTGDILDSLTITGNVTDLLTSQKLEDALVSLYDSNDTLDVFNSPPMYLTKTNKKGNFQFDNIKNGQYKMYAILDKNKNMKLNLKKEAHGFKKEIIQLDSSINKMNIPLVNIDLSELKLQRAKPTGHYFVIKYNKPLLKYKLKSEKPDSVLYRSLSKDRKEIKFYNANSFKDSLLVYVTSYDSIGYSKKDTVYLKFEKTKRKKDKYQITSSIEPVDRNNPAISSQINFSKPIKKINFDSLFINIDSLNKIFIKKNDLVINKEKNQITINKIIPKELLKDRLELDKKSETYKLDSLIQTTIDYHLYMGKNTFPSIENDTSKVKKVNFEMLEPTTLGTISIQIESDEPSYTIQLLNDSFEVVKEIKNVKKYTIHHLDPGTYKLRILIDNNKDGKWNLGNIRENIPPEEVIFYTNDEGKKDLILRANWELGPINVKF